MDLKRVVPPRLVSLSGIRNEWLFKSSSQPPPTLHRCWCCSRSLQKASSDMCRVMTIMFSADHRRFITETK